MRRAYLAGLALSLLATAATSAQPAPDAARSPAPASAQPAPDAAPVPATSAPAVSGLRVEDLRKGIGLVAEPGMTLVVHYTGWLYQPNALGYRGRKFDSSRDRGTPLSFTLGNGTVIKGWDEGLVGLQVGGLRRLVIPPDMAYGDRDIGHGLIPPNSTLVFEVELLGIESSTVRQNTK